MELVKKSDEHRLRPMSRRQVLKLLGATAVAALVPGVFLNVYRFEINRYEVALEGLHAPLRVVQLSDLHYGPFIHEGSVRAWVAAAVGERPDAVVITGDFVDSNLRRPLAPFQDALAGLEAPLGVWGVWGNHDRVHFEEAATLERALSEIGIELLDNRGVSLRDDVYLAGVDDFLKGRPDAQAALRERPAAAASLLMCHNPDYLLEIAEDANFVLCGHTHGGQVRLPLVGALFTSSEYGERFAMGFVKKPLSAFVSRGLGVTVLPLRLFCLPEIVTFDFVPV
jgi:uncharacterized protein